MQFWGLAPQRENKDSIWNAFASFRFTIKQKRGKPRSAGQAVPCENAKHTGDAQIWKGCSHSGTSGVVSGGKEISQSPLPSVVLRVPLSPWISDRSHCVSPVRVNCEKKSQKENWGKKQRVGHLKCCTVTSKGTKPGYLYHYGPRCHKLHTWQKGIKQAVLNS